MLSIAKLRVGQEAYQLSGVAQSLDDYYTGAGEASGQWAGVGAERLGLEGDVAPDDLRAVLAGIAPGTGGLNPNGDTINPHRNRVPGFDLTFKAPKSVSVLYAVSDDPRVQAAIIDAGEQAVHAALGWLEREATHVRRGTGNETFLSDLATRDPDGAAAARIRSVPATGVVAAMFRHRTSRAGDPLLHWHTLVANLAEGPDGRWTAIVHPDIYRAVRAAGEVFQTVMRDELTVSLGVTWRPGRHVPEIAGVPQGLLDQFSKRSREIEDWLDATGTPSSHAGRQAAVLATRRNKPEVEHERFDAAWKVEATAYGWGPDAAEMLLLDTRPVSAPTTVADDAWVGQLARELTGHNATFTRNDLVQAVAARLQSGGAMRDIERTVAAVLASPLVVPVGAGRDRWTSCELLDIERRFLDVASSTVGTLPALQSAAASASLASFPTIGNDQRAAVLTLTASTDAVSVLVGPAGTGKTFTLDAVRAAYESSGYRVIGTAPSARAAHELEQGAHIASSTMHRLLGSWQRDYDLPDRSTVLVVDEGAMAGTRELEAMVTATVTAGGRVILVGDHHQLPEVTAGGGFAALATTRKVTVAELSVNRRQDHQWERDALTALRDGHVAAAVASYREHDRVEIKPDRDAMLATAVTRWSAAVNAGLDPVLLAGTNGTVIALNLAVRKHLVGSGHLGVHLGTWGSRVIAVGERLVLRANNYDTVDINGRRLPLLNGHTATVTGIGTHGVLAKLHHADTIVELDAGYLGSSVDYGYALTTHRAQGGTWDLAIGVGAEGLYREAAYLALSRGRSENLLVLTRAEADAFDTELSRHDSILPLPGEDPDDADADLIRMLNQSRAKTLALTDDPYADLIGKLASRTDLVTLEALANNAVTAEQKALAIVGTRPTLLQTTIDRAIKTANHVAVGHVVKPCDRNNIGVVIALDDSAGRVLVEFTSTDGRSAERSFRWDELTIIEPRHPAQRVPGSAAAAALNSVVNENRAGIIRWTQILAADNVAMPDAHIYSRATGLLVDRAAASLAAAQPEWLGRTLGERPMAPAAAQVWDDTVRDIAAYRSRQHIADRTTPFGPAPRDGQQLAVFEQIATSLANARVWLDSYSPTPAIPLRFRSEAELVERQTELDAILATAPADQRQTIQALATGQLTLTDTTEILRDALGSQGDRRRWILEHWPHIVESAEVDRGVEAASLWLDCGQIDSARHCEVSVPGIGFD